MTPSPWLRPAERAALVRVGAELNKRADRVDAAVGRGPGQRSASVRVRVDAGAELDEEPDRVDPVRFRRPHERFVEHLLVVIGGLPGGEPAVGSVEAAVRAGLRRAGQLPDQLQVAEAGGNAQVERLSAEQCGDLAVAPEERRNQRRASVAAREHVGARAGVQHQPGELASFP